MELAEENEMPTINSKALARQLARQDGIYHGDSIRCVKIVEYENCFNGGIAYGLIYAGTPLDAYSESPYVRNPRTFWEYGQKFEESLAGREAGEAEEEGKAEE